MKKLFALVLAVAMVLSMASIAMADSSMSIDGEREAGVGLDKIIYTGTKLPQHNYDKDADDNNAEAVKAGKADTTIAYGKTVYLPLYAMKLDMVKYVVDTTKPLTKADEIDGIKVSARWLKNGDYIESIDIVKKNDQYWVAIKTTGTSMDENDVEGEIYFTGKAYTKDTNNDGKINSDDKKQTLKKDDNTYEITLTLGYDVIKGVAADKDKYNVIFSDPYKYVFDDDADKCGMSDDEFEFSCDEAEDVTFTVDTTHQSDIVLAMDCDAIDEVEDKYPAANLDFYNFNGATFKKTGELFIGADEGTYLYEIVDGAAKEVDATYDEYDEGFYLKTKTLGSYVISDVKLATAAAATETTDSTANPTTGAAL